MQLLYIVSCWQRNVKLVKHSTYGGGGSGQTFYRQSQVGSDRRSAGSGQRKVTRGQLCDTKQKSLQVISCGYIEYTFEGIPHCINLILCTGHWKIFFAMAVEGFSLRWPLLSKPI